MPDGRRRVQEEELMAIAPSSGLSEKSNQSFHGSAGAFALGPFAVGGQGGESFGEAAGAGFLAFGGGEPDEVFALISRGEGGEVGGGGFVLF